MMNLVSKIFKKIIFNIHTILLVAGMAFVAVSAFLLDIKVGFLVCGIELIVLALLISWNLGKGGE